MADATIDWVIRATDRTTAAFRSVDANLAGLTRGFKTLAGFTGFAAITAGLTRMAGELLDTASQLQDTSERLGVSAEALQVYKIAAEEAGGSLESFTSALQFLAKITDQAVGGQKKAGEVFRQLGIDAKKFAELPLDRRFRVIAEQLAQVDDPALRLALQLKALGRSAGDLAPVLAKGADGLDKIDRELRGTNSIISDAQIKALDEAGEAWERFKTRALASLAPVLTKTLELVEAAVDGAQRVSEVPLAFPSLAFALTPEPLSPRKGPTSRRRAGSLLGADAASIIGPAGKKSADEANALFEKANADLDKALDKYRATREAAAKSTAADIRRVIEQVQTPIERYRATVAEIEQLSKVGLPKETAARAELAAQTELNAALREAYDLSADGIQAAQDMADAAKLIDQTRTPYEEFHRNVERATDLLERGAIDVETYNRAVQQFGVDAADAIFSQAGVTKDQTISLLEDIKSATDGFARDFARTLISATGDVGDAFKRLGQIIAETILTKTVTEPLVNAILGSLSTPGRAIGGPVTAGAPYLVGERGPEVFVPASGGSVQPASGPMTVNFQITSLDPSTAASTIVANRDVITEVVRRAFRRAGVTPRLA